jgi:hypothetical protein
MARVLGQMRASTDPLSGAKGLKERAHFGLIAGKRPRCYRARKYRRLARRSFQRAMLCMASQIRSSLASRPAFFLSSLSFAPGRWWWALLAFCAMPSARQRSAAVSRRCSLRSPVLEHIANAPTDPRMPEQPGIARRRYRIQDLPKLGDDKSGADHPAPNRIAASRLQVPCRQSLPSPALPARPHPRVDRCCDH